MTTIGKSPPSSNFHEWDANLFDGVSPSPQPIKVSVMPNGLHIGRLVDEGVLWRYDNLRQTQGFYAGQQIRLETCGSPSQVLTISDANFLDVVHHIAETRVAHFHRPGEQSRRPLWIIAATIGIICIGVWMYVEGLPSFTKLVSQYVPISWEEKTGKAVADQAIVTHHECVEPKRKLIIDDLVSKLTTVLPSNPYTFRVSVVDSPVVNAFAAPGGYIVVYKGLLQFTKSPAELAGVLAHEIEHVVYRHVTRMLLQQASLGVVLGAVTGDLNGAMTLGVQAASILGGLAYSRDAEEEADRAAFKLLIAARIDPRGLVSFFERLQGNHFQAKLSKYLSTHPPFEDRIQALKVAGTGMPERPLQLITPVEWGEMADICFVHASAQQ
ncbi:MAG: M48 family metallopeptidase [Nitrospira sp.]|nr:M48 family metallopeptidase [Nitrospira sp.]